MEKYTLIFTGDILCDGSMLDAVNDNFDIFFSAVSDDFKDADLLVGNIETPVAGAELGYTNELYRFNTPIAFLHAVKKVGFDVLTLANNHCMDRGREGLINTIDNCHACGFETLGTYKTQEERDRVFVKEFGDIKVAFINYTYGINYFVHHCLIEHPYHVNMFQPEEQREGSIHLLDSLEDIKKNVDRIYHSVSSEYEIVQPYLQQLKLDIENAKKEADFVVMLMHSGGQYNDEVDAYTTFLAKEIKHYGADIIVGHHPHIIQKCKRDDDGFLTIFSLGNFLHDPITTEGHTVNPDVGAVFYLTLSRNVSGEVIYETSFKIYKTIMKGGIPCVVDTYVEYEQTKIEQLKQEILHYANRFANTERFTDVQKKYSI